MMNNKKIKTKSHNKRLNKIQIKKIGHELRGNKKIRKDWGFSSAKGDGSPLDNNT